MKWIRLSLHPNGQDLGKLMELDFLIFLSLCHVVISNILRGTCCEGFSYRIDVHPTAQCRTTQELNATCCNSLYLSWCVSWLKNTKRETLRVFFVCCMRLQKDCNLTLQIFLFTAYKAKKKQDCDCSSQRGEDAKIWSCDSIFCFCFLSVWYLCFWFPCFLKIWRKIAVPNSLPFPPPWGLQTCFWLFIVCFGFVVSLSDHVKTHGKMQVSVGEA